MSARGEKGAALGERVLAEHAQRFLDLSPGLFAIGTLDGSLTWVNAAWEDLLGVDREAMLGLGYMEFLHPEDRAVTQKLIEEAHVMRSSIRAFENRYRSRDGDYRILHWTSVIDEEAGLVYAMAQDVTELHRSRDELTQSRGRLSEAQRLSRLGSWTYDPPTGAVTWSDGLYHVFGVDPTEFEPSYEGHLAFVHPDDVERLERTVARLWQTGDPYEFDYRIITGRGEERILHSRARITSRDDGTRLISGVCQDVTEARRAQRELARSLSLQKATLEATADGVLVVSTEGRAVTWNENFARMWRLPKELVEEGDDQKMQAFAVDQLADPEAFVSRVRELYGDPERESFDVLEFKDGRIVERYSSPQRLDGEVVGRVWSFRDVTDRLRAEREKLALEARLDRLESLGRLAGGIAHDFNNLLVTIVNYAELAREQLPESDATRADLDEVVRAAERGSALTRELVAFSRQEMVEPRPLDLSALIADNEGLLRGAVGESVDLRFELAEELPAVEADPSQLERVLMNLAVNAHESMPDGGVAVISTEGVEVPDGAAALSGPVVRLRVRDQGVGMEEEVATRALEPFFTTKPRGEAAGLGLATVYGIVNQAGGELHIDSTPRRGTTITIDFPASSQDPAAPRGPTAEVSGGGDGTVLVVEDEAPVRRLTARLLRDAGFRTLEAAGGEEALALLRETDAELTLLLTDIVMPGMSGRELADRARALRPQLPVLFMSGYTDDVAVRHGVARADVPFLAKPFTRDTLLAAVNEAVKRAAERA